MSGRNSAYSPLPQSNSDSDGSSEEELHVPQDNWVVNRVSKTLNSRTEKICDSKKQNKINYKPVDTDGDIVVTLIKFQSNSDEVSMLKPNKNFEIFSTSRKVCFILSLLLCIFTTVIFIWVLPCNVASCFSTSNTKDHLYTWEKTLPGLELYGPINIVSDSSIKTKNIIFLLRSPFEGLSNSKSGMISLNGKNGTVIWKIWFQKHAADIDCNVIDVDQDGCNDCILFGNSFLKIVHSLSGKELWDAHKSNKKKLKLLDFPLIVPDLDGDNVNDLVTSCSLTNFDKKNILNNDSHNYLVIISGKSGVIINKPLKIDMCYAVHNLIFENNSFISFTCYNSAEKESIQTMNLIKVYNTLKNIPEEKFTSYKWFKLHQHQGDEKEIQVDGHKLILENQGQCPQNCIIFVDIKDDREGNNRTIYSYKNSNTFGVVTAVAKSEKLRGFLLKIWMWHSRKEQFSDQSKFGFPIQKKVSIKKRKGENLKKKENKLTLDKEILKESNSESKRFKRTAGKVNGIQINKSVVNSSDFRERVITQTIVIITFNNTNTVVRNITKDEIIQICPPRGPCEPDVNQQRHSILVTDLNEDGTQEIITFTSKYVHGISKTKEDKRTWQIQSNIKVMSLKVL